MKYLTTVKKLFFPKINPIPVGRWKLEKCDAAINNKVDLSNEDHCGPCGEYTLIKKNCIKYNATNKDAFLEKRATHRIE